MTRFDFFVLRKMSRLFLPATLASASVCYPRQAPTQSLPNLRSASLEAHARLPLNNPAGVPIPELLEDDHRHATSAGMAWKGMQLITGEGLPGVSGSNQPALSEMYRKLTCSADAIVIGHMTAAAYHLSQMKTSVYADYAFLVDTFLKGNKSSATAKAGIIVTRPGGSLKLPEGPVSCDYDAYPRLRANSTYLLFLQYLPESSAYQPVNSLSTLVEEGGQWRITQKSLHDTTKPEFGKPLLETSIHKWVEKCR